MKRNSTPTTDQPIKVIDEMDLSEGRGQRLKIILGYLLLLILTATACNKEEATCRSYVCETVTMSYGRGTSKTDTTDCMTRQQAAAYEAARTISTDNFFQQTTCK